jgi:hypothetical protein
MRRGALGGSKCCRMGALAAESTTSDPVHLGAQGQLDEQRFSPTAEPVLTYRNFAWFVECRSGLAMVSGGSVPVGLGRRLHEGCLIADVAFLSQARSRHWNVTD